MGGFKRLNLSLLWGVILARFINLEKVRNLDCLGYSIIFVKDSTDSLKHIFILGNSIYNDALLLRQVFISDFTAIAGPYVNELIVDILNLLLKLLEVGEEWFLFQIKRMDVFSDKIDELYARQGLENPCNAINITFLFAHHLGVLAVVLEHLVVVWFTALFLVLKKHTI